MRRLEVRLTLGPAREIEVGSLADADRRIYFEYATSFLDTGLELSPYKLPLRPGLMEHTDRAFGPLPGVFDDSLPDGWGLLLMDRRFREQGLEPRVLSPLDRLAWLGSSTMGALTYHPPAKSDETDGDELDLLALGHHAEEVFAGDAAEVLPLLQRAGGSPGGACPKVLVGLRGDHLVSGEGSLPEDHEPWLVKFAARVDASSAGPLEYATAGLAVAAGIDMPATRLFEVGSGRDLRRWFGVQRFDRGPRGRRLHMHTFANLVHADFRVPSADYDDIFKVTRALTRDHRDVLRLFRRMVFNVAVGNRDDHGKNFAYLLDDETGEWCLSPAYDLIPSDGPGGEHSTTLLGEGRSPTRAHCMELARGHGLRERDAAEIIDQVNAALSRWSEFADEAAVPRTTRGAVKRRLRTL